MKIYVLKNAGSYFAGWTLGARGRSVPTWTQDAKKAVVYSESELAKFKTLAGYKRLGTVAVEEVS
jgi:hypothetical protein